MAIQNRVFLNPSQRTVTNDSRNQNGSYLLELGVVLVGVVGIILGGADIARLLQGRGAVRAGVAEGLRCLTTTDDPHGCRNNLSPAGQFTLPPRYDVFAAGFEIPYRQISVSARWPTEPVYQVPTETFRGEDVTVLFSIPQRRLLQQQVVFPVQARSEYLLEVSAPPFLTGSALNPSVRSLRNRSEVLAPVETIGIAARRFGLAGLAQDVNTDAYDARWALRGSSSFTVSVFGGSDPSSSRSNLAKARARGAVVQCFQPPENSSSRVIVGSGETVRVDWSKRPVTCVSPTDGNTEIYQRDTLAVPVALRISGAGFTDTPGTEGQLVVRMEWNEGSRHYQVDLGGRTFAGSGTALPAGVSATDRNDDGTLVMRGVVATSMSKETREKYPEEVSLHGDLPLIPDGTVVTLNFFLRKISGPDSASVSWRGDTVEVYHPRYQFVEQLLYPNESPIPTQCRKTEIELQSEGLTTVIGAPVTHCSFGEPRAATISETYCQDVPAKDTEVIEQHPLNRVAAAWEHAKISPETYVQPVRFTAAVEGAPACPDKQQSRSCRKGQNVTILGNCEAMALPQGVVLGCESETPMPENAREISVARSIAVSPISSGLIEVGACKMATLPACVGAGLAPLTSRPFAPTPGEPACSAVTVTSPVTFLYPPEAAPMFDAQCEGQLEIAKANIQLHAKIPKTASITAACLSLEWRFSLYKPDNGDVPYRTTAEGRYGLAGSRLSATQAEAICVVAQGRCEKRQLATREVTTGGRDSNIGSGSINRWQVESVVFEAVQAAYPRAVPCSVGLASAPDCLAITVDQTGIGSAAHARIRARLRLPLALLSFAAKDVEVVEFEDMRLTEGAVASR